MYRIPNMDHLLGGELCLWIDKASRPKILGTTATPMLEPEICVAELLTPCSRVVLRNVTVNRQISRAFENFCLLKYDNLQRTEMSEDSDSSNSRIRVEAA